MARYSVLLCETVFYTVCVDAENEADAYEAATATWCQSENPDQEFEGRGEGVEPVSLEVADND